MATAQGQPGTGAAGHVTVEWTRQRPTYAPLTGDFAERARFLVTTRWEHGEAHWKAKWEQFYRFEKLVEMVSKKKQYDWKANAFLPYPFAISEQSAAMKWLSLFANRPFVTVKARHPGLAEIADRREALIDYHLSAGGDLDVVRYTLRMFRQCERYGKSVAMVVPAWNPRTMRYRSVETLPTAMGPLARQAWKTVETRDYGLKTVMMDLTDFVIQPGYVSINGPEGAQWLIRRYYKTMEEMIDDQAAGLMGAAVGGENVEQIGTSDDQPTNEYKLRRIFLQQQDDVDRYQDKFDQPVENLEYHGRVPREMVDPELAQLEDNMGLDPFQRIITVANKHTVVGNVANGWDHRMKPFVEMDCVPAVYDFFGKGKIEPIEHLTYVGNEIVNMRLDNVKMAVNGLIGVDGRRMPPGWKKRLVSQPWGVLETMGPPREIVERLNLGDVTASSYQEQQQIFTLIQEADAVNETMMGSPGAKARTLGEHRMKSEQASMRLQFELVGQADQLLGYPYGYSGFILAYDRQFMPMPQYLSLINPLSPDDMMIVSVDETMFAEEDQHFIYLPTGATEGMNIQAKRLDLTHLLDVVGDYVPYLAQMYGPGFVHELTKITFKTFGFDPSRFMPRGMPATGPGGVPIMPAGPGGMGMPGMMPPGQEQQQLQQGGQP